MPVISETVWFYDTSTDQHVQMEAQPNGVWVEVKRLETRLSAMRNLAGEFKYRG